MIESGVTERELPYENDGGMRAAAMVPNWSSSTCDAHVGGTPLQQVGKPHRDFVDVEDVEPQADRLARVLHRLHQPRKEHRAVDQRLRSSRASG